MTDHGDSGISQSQKINGIQIIDDNIYDHDSTTAFIVIDNVEITDSLSDRFI